MTTHMPMTPIGDPVSAPSTPTNPADDDLRKRIAQALALAHDYREGTSDAVDCGPSVADYADARAALSVVTPVLKGLRAELENANRANGELAAQVLEVLGENARLRSERDALSSLLRGMARRVGEVRRELDRAVPDAFAELIEFAHEARRIGWAEDRSEEYIRHWGAVAGWLRSHLPAGHPLAYRRAVVETDEEAEAHASRPSVSDQTPATPDDVDERPVVNRIADLIRSGAAVGTTAIDTAREIWACLEMTGQLAAPSSVQGDTTPDKEA